MNVPEVKWLAGFESPQLLTAGGRQHEVPYLTRGRQSAPSPEHYSMRTSRWTLAVKVTSPSIA